MNEIKINPFDGKTIKNKIRTEKSQEKSEFKDLIKSSIEKVNNSLIESDTDIVKMAEGKTGIHDTMISMQKADITLRLFLQIRNKAIDAYREMMRMPF